MAVRSYDLVYQAIVDILEKSGSTNPEKSKSNREIVKSLKDRVAKGLLQVELSDGTLLNYLSHAANNDANSNIVSGGPRAGYWLENVLDEPINPVEAQSEKISLADGKAAVEKDLYPLMELWLEKKGYKSKDSSTLKAGGKWGNPDIIGVERVDIFGAVQIELVSCEVKISLTNWEHVIFEAISHKRFCNRSWFCFRSATEVASIPKGMDYYAERYRVGIVEIAVSDSDLADLKSGKRQPLDFIDKVIERVPALYDFVPLKEQSDLIERTGISITVTF